MGDVYKTPWGTRELSQAEADDLCAQGVQLSLTGGDEISTSIDDERAALAQVQLTDATDNGGTAPSGAKIPEPRR